MGVSDETYFDLILEAESEANFVNILNSIYSDDCEKMAIGEIVRQVTEVMRIDRR